MYWTFPTNISSFNQKPSFAVTVMNRGITKLGTLTAYLLANRCNGYDVYQLISRGFDCGDVWPYESQILIYVYIFIFLLVLLVRLLFIYWLLYNKHVFDRCILIYQYLFFVYLLDVYSFRVAYCASDWILPTVIWWTVFNRWSGLLS